MLQTLLFLLVIIIGFAYAVKYGNKAKREINEYKKNKNRFAPENQSKAQDLNKEK